MDSNINKRARHASSDNIVSIDKEGKIVVKKVVYEDEIQTEAPTTMNDDKTIEEEENSDGTIEEDEN